MRLQSRRRQTTAGEKREELVLGRNSLVRRNRSERSELTVNQHDWANLPLHSRPGGCNPSESGVFEHSSWHVPNINLELNRTIYSRPLPVPNHRVAHSKTVMMIFIRGPGQPHFSAFSNSIPSAFLDEDVRWYAAVS